MENSFPQRFDRFLDAIQALLMSFLVKLGPFFVALMPALFTAYSIFYTFQPEAGFTLAMCFAVVVGLAMETVGIVATHTTIDLYNAKQQGIIEPLKFKVMSWLVPIYVLGVASVIVFSEDAFTPLVKGLGVASPFLTCTVYIAVALARDLAQVATKQTERAERQNTLEDEQRHWEWKKERLELEMKHEEKLARIQAKHVKQPVNSIGQIVQNDVNSHVFDTVNLSKTKKKNQLLDRMLEIYLDNPKVGVSAMASHLNVSRQTIYNYLNEMEQTGRLRRNGQGVEVLR